MIRRYVKNCRFANRATHRLPNVVFLVFVMDGYRSYLSSQAYDGSFEGFNDSDTLITLATDTALAAQNATVAAESLGYATCPIGGLRMIGNDLIELLKLPKYTYPIFWLMYR